MHSGGLSRPRRRANGTGTGPRAGDRDDGTVAKEYSTPTRPSSQKPAPRTKSRSVRLTESLHGSTSGAADLGWQAMSPRTDTARRWLVVAVVTVLTSLLFAVLHLPSPVLFGALAAGMLHALTSPVELDMPPLAFRLGQALVGAVIGALVKLPTLARLASDWPSVALVTVGTLAISLVAGRALALRRDVSPATGAFALIAGGASGIVALARELGADDRVVTVVQYLRVLLVLLAMPLVTGLVFHPPSGRGSLGGGPTRWLPDLVFVAVAVGVGLLAQRVVRAP